MLDRIGCKMERRRVHVLRNLRYSRSLIHSLIHYHILNLSYNLSLIHYHIYHHIHSQFLILSQCLAFRYARQSE